MNQDIEFLKELQQELNTQETDWQAAPRFWTIGDYKWTVTSDDDAERYTVDIADDESDVEIFQFIEDVKEEEDVFSEKALKDSEDIQDVIDAIEWVQDFINMDARITPERKIHFIHKSTMFITKEEAKSHLASNRHNYGPDAHTFAMTAQRAPKVNRLMNILQNFDWDSIQDSNL